MDRYSFSSEFGDGQTAALSMSLISYGSDLETSVDDTTPNLKSKTLNSVSDTDTVIEDDSEAFDETAIAPVRKRIEQLSCTGLSKKTKDEVEKVLSDTEAAKRKYLEHLEVFHALQSVLSSEKLPHPTRANAEKLLRKEELKGFVASRGGTGLLGLKDDLLEADCPEPLSESDQKLVRLAVEGQLIQKAKELKQLQSSKQETLIKISSNASNNFQVKVELEHTVRMSSLRADLNFELDRYYKFLATLDSLLESVVQMRTNQMSEMCTKTIDGFLAKAQLLKQRAKLINADIQNAIYSEDTLVVAAMQCLEKELDLLISDTETDLAKTNGLLAAYDRVKCREYSLILEEYQLIMKRIKSAKYVLEEAKSYS